MMHSRFTFGHKISGLNYIIYAVFTAFRISSAMSARREGKFPDPYVCNMTPFVGGQSVARTYIL